MYMQGVKNLEANQTAYRVLHILSWLIQSPLSLDAIRQRCQQLEASGTELSEDTVGLYIKTLRQVGCHIKRPSRSNNFCYVLQSHPFTLPMDVEHYQWLIQIKRAISRQAGYQTMLALDQFVLQLIDSHPDVAWRQQWRAGYFEKTRSVDYSLMEEVIQQLEQAIADSGALQITYRHSRFGKRPFVMYPLSLQYERGALYVVSNRQEGFQEPGGGAQKVRYRVDRIVKCERVQLRGLELLARVGTRKGLNPEVVVVDVMDDMPFERPLVDMNETWQFVREDSGEGYTRVVIPCEDWFAIKQRLFQLESTFVIRYPDWCREDIVKTLETMACHYKADIDSTSLNLKKPMVYSLEQLPEILR